MCTRPESTHFWLRTISYIRRKNDTKPKHFPFHKSSSPMMPRCKILQVCISVKSPDCVVSVRVLFQVRLKESASSVTGERHVLPPPRMLVLSTHGTIRLCVLLTCFSWSSRLDEWKGCRLPSHKACCCGRPSPNWPPPLVAVTIKKSQPSM